MTNGDGLFGELSSHARPAAVPPVRKAVSFSHSSERLFANLLDFYGIVWDYEPTSFDISNGAGEEKFTPDFYLPDYDLYVELTTMSQKLVTRKNRKVRMLAERHPEIRCKIFYQRDIFRLATKHGLEIPTEDLTANASQG